MKANRFADKKQIYKKMQVSKFKWDCLERFLDPEIVKTITQDFGFEYVMPVQKTVIPLFSKSYDVAVESCTGSGKTLGFLLPMIQRLISDPESDNQRDLKENMEDQDKEGRESSEIKNAVEEDLIGEKLSQIGSICGMVVSPTRELAQQIFDNLNRVLAGIQKRGRGKRLGARLLIGGQNNQNVKGLRDNLILVGTPGRLRQELFTENINGNFFNQ